MTFPRLQHQGMEIVFSMVWVILGLNESTVDILALVDGILNNDAIKHNGNEHNNETWTQLLLDFKFFDDNTNHIMYLRRRFVLGAAEWMAGKHGSSQNDKDLLQYTDGQWRFIWTTMLEDGAWAVPSLRDAKGNTIKENYAPEMLIKFIAHELKCHIISYHVQSVQILP